MMRLKIDIDNRYVWQISEYASDIRFAGGISRVSYSLLFILGWYKHRNSLIIDKY